MEIAFMSSKVVVNSKAYLVSNQVIGGLSRKRECSKFIIDTLFNDRYLPLHVPKKIAMAHVEYKIECIMNVVMNCVWVFRMLTDDRYFHLPSLICLYCIRIWWPDWRELEEIASIFASGDFVSGCLLSVVSQLTHFGWGLGFSLTLLLQFLMRSLISFWSLKPGTRCESFFTSITVRLISMLLLDSQCSLSIYFHLKAGSSHIVHNTRKWNLSPRIHASDLISLSIECLGKCWKIQIMLVFSVYPTTDNSP